MISSTYVCPSIGVPPRCTLGANSRASRMAKEAPRGRPDLPECGVPITRGLQFFCFTSIPLSHSDPHSVVKPQYPCSASQAYTKYRLPWHDLKPLSTTCSCADLILQSSASIRCASLPLIKVVIPWHHVLVIQKLKQHSTGPAHLLLDFLC